MEKIQNIKGEINKLYKEREGVEEEVKTCVARLQELGGFPRGDIDLVSVRTDRMKVQALTNDHKMLSDKIEKLLHELHALTRDKGEGNEVPVAPPYHTSMDQIHAVVAPIAVPTSTKMPFAEVDELSMESPAMESGIRLGDKILRCNHVTAQTPNALQVMGTLVAESENSVMDVEVLRNDEKVSLKLRPKTWTGRGLLGCHLKPIK
eukprot:jgi/Picsp_1/2826/NSC_01052-R1_26s proteasome non-atpase regulatory subunit 9